MEGQSGGYYFACREVTTIYDDEKHKDEDYLAKSAIRSEVSLSGNEARRLWSVAGRDVGLDEDL